MQSGDCRRGSLRGSSSWSYGRRNLCKRLE
jgi:hypothetical protein